MKNTSTLLVFLQKLFILLFLISGPLVAKNIYLLVIELLAIALGAWAIMTMVRKSKFRVDPEPSQNAHLLETGPYTYIRNPMYTAILLGFGALVLDSFTLLRFSIYILEAIVLLKKISVEEQLLPQKFPGYEDYKKRTRRLLPFLY